MEYWTLIALVLFILKIIVTLKATNLMGPTILKIFIKYIANKSKFK